LHRLEFLFLPLDSTIFAATQYGEYLTKVAAHSCDVCVVTCMKLCWCIFSLSSAGIFKAWLIEAATSAIFHGFTKRAPAPRDWAAPANWHIQSIINVFFCFSSLFLKCIFIQNPNRSKRLSLEYTHKMVLYAITKGTL